MGIERHHSAGVPDMHGDAAQTLPLDHQDRPRGGRVHQRPRWRG